MGQLSEGPGELLLCRGDQTHYLCRWLQSRLVDVMDVSAWFLLQHADPTVLPVWINENPRAVRTVGHSRRPLDYEAGHMRRFLL